MTNVVKLPGVNGAWIPVDPSTVEEVDTGIMPGTCVLTTTNGTYHIALTVADLPKHLHPKAKQGMMREIVHLPGVDGFWYHVDPQASGDVTPGKDPATTRVQTGKVVYHIALPIEEVRQRLFPSLSAEPRGIETFRQALIGYVRYLYENQMQIVNEDERSEYQFWPKDWGVIQQDIDRFLTTYAPVIPREPNPALAAAVKAAFQAPHWETEPPPNTLNVHALVHALHAWEDRRIDPDLDHAVNPELLFAEQYVHDHQPLTPIETETDVKEDVGYVLHVAQAYESYLMKHRFEPHYSGEFAAAYVQEHPRKRVQQAAPWRSREELARDLVAWTRYLYERGVTLHDADGMVLETAIGQMLTLFLAIYQPEAEVEGYRGPIAVGMRFWWYKKRTKEQIAGAVRRVEQIETLLPRTTVTFASSSITEEGREVVTETRFLEEDFRKVCTPIPDEVERYEGPFVIGKRFWWRPGTAAAERIVIEGYEERNGAMWYQSRGEMRGLCWNEEAVMREACVPLPEGT